MLWRILAGLLVFGVIVFIHELGHFLAAKWNKIKVTEFSIGMGPELFAIQGKETRYCMKLLPIGGSVSLKDAEDGDDKEAYENKPIWRRMTVVGAGVFFNFLLAFLLALVVVIWNGYDQVQVTHVLEDSPAYKAGLETGDVITTINKTPVIWYSDMMVYLLVHPITDKSPIHITRVRTEQETGKTNTERLTIVPEKQEESESYRMGFSYGPVRNKVGSVWELFYYSGAKIRSCIITSVDSIRILAKGNINVQESVAGPVKVASMIGDAVEVTKEFGISSVIVTLAELTLILSACVGLANLIPLPVLDGGILLFLIIEKLRGYPVNPQWIKKAQRISMICLLILMAVVIINDIYSLAF